MKKLLLLSLTSFILLTCKKIANDSSSSQASNLNPDISAPPGTVPTFTSLIGNVDQWKRLAIGFTILFNDPNMCNNMNLRVRLNNLQAGIGEDPVNIVSFYNSLNTSPVPFSVPSANNSDLYDAIANRISAKAPPTSITAWDNTFFGSFVHSFTTGTGPVLQPLFNQITIPQRVLQAGKWTLPALVLPDPQRFLGAGLYPMTAYGYNNSTGNVTEVIITNEDMYDDLVEGGDYMIMVLTFNGDEIWETELDGSCEGGFVPYDNVCDGDCGENESNSPGDCGENNPKDKRLFLYKVRINKDFSDRLNTQEAERQYWEKWASGCYDLNVSCWAVPTNSHWTAVKKMKLEKIEMADVTRQRKKLNGTIVTRGTSVMQEINERNGDLAQLANHFNPAAHYVSIFFAENDPTAQNVDVDYKIGTTVVDQMEWRGALGNMMAGKVISFQRLKGDNTMAGTLMRVDIPVDPLAWTDGTRLSEPIKVYTHTTGADNTVDFILFYFRDRH